MEAQASQDGAPQEAGAATPQTETQTPQVQVPPELMERFDEVAGFQQEMRPLLEQWQQQQQQQGQPEEEGGSYDEFVDPETGYILDPEALQKWNQDQINAGIQEGVSPLQQQLEQINQRFVQEEFADLQDQYPQLADSEFQRTFIPRVEQEAGQLARDLGMGPDYAQKLALNPRFVRAQYLAGMASEQAQQGVPAGDRGVHLEGGTGNPGQPEADGKQEWLAMSRGGRQGPFGVPIDQL
jgi:hypothetical protein